jgi:hypothetical protein
MEGNGFRVLGREDILGASDIKTEIVQVPEWSGAVYVRGLTGTERDDLELGMLEQRGKSRTLNLRNLRAKLVAASLVDSEAPDARRLFSEGDVKALGEKSAAALRRVFEVAQRLSGLTDDDVEGLTEELGEATSVVSGTDSL